MHFKNKNLKLKTKQDCFWKTVGQPFFIMDPRALSGLLAWSWALDSLVNIER